MWKVYLTLPTVRSHSNFLNEIEIDNENEIIVRREIAGEGKSRAFINDTPVNLSQLQQLSGLLVDLHQQFDSLDLGQNHFQLQMLDALARQLPLKAKYSAIYQQFNGASKDWENLVHQKAEAIKEYDYFHYLLANWKKQHLKPGELEQLESELNPHC